METISGLGQGSFMLVEHILVLGDFLCMVPFRLVEHFLVVVHHSPMLSDFLRMVSFCLRGQRER